ncbi:MAG: amidohydrolase family protein, partial [Thermodesulfobacteriota bacterium]
MNPKLPSAIADFHVHLFPDRFFDAIWKRFVSDYGWNVLHKLYWRQCVDFLHEKGVSPIAFSNYAHKKGVMGPLNEFNLRVLEETTDCWCFAAFHPEDEDGLAMAADVLSHPRVAGIKLQLLVQRFYPQDPRLFPLYELVMEKNKRILFHVGTGPVGNPFVGADHFEKVLLRYPALPAIVAHMGGLEYGAFLAFLDRHPG